MSLVIKVGLASCGLAAGAGEVYDAIQKHIKKNKIDAELKKTACIGMCFVEPLVEIYEEKKKSHMEMLHQKMLEILLMHLLKESLSKKM